MKPFSLVFINLKAEPAIKGLFDFLEVESLHYTRNREFLIVSVRASRLIQKRELNRIEELINEQILPDMECRAVIRECYDLPEAYDFKAILTEYLESVILDLSRDNPMEKRFLEKGSFEVIGEDSLKITLDDHPINRKNARNYEETLVRLMQDRFSLDIRVQTVFREAKPVKDRRLPEYNTVVIKLPKKGELPAENGEALMIPAGDAEKAAVPETKTAGKRGRTASLRKTSGDAWTSGGRNGAPSGNRKGKVKLAEKRFVSTDPNVLYGRNFMDEPRPISDYDYNEEGAFCIEGSIMEFESKPLKNGERTILTFSVTDYTDSISAKIFAANDDVPDISSRLKPGTCIRLKGIAKYDAFEHEVSIASVQGIVKSDKVYDFSRIDTAPEKRVELHCHTQFSENDALSPVSELLKTASSWGHSAIAITDHGCVYAFPEALHAMDRDKDRYASFKVIYGMEGYLVDDTVESVKYPGNSGLNDSCVVFDIETTGFSPVNDRIIEIGAVKIRDGSITDRFSCFVDPQIPIPLRIEQLTHISNDMVKDAKTIDQVLPEFLAFIEGSYLTAHNAGFDVGFITENARRLGLYEKPFTYADTLGIARAFLPNLHNYRLETVAKELGVSLGSHHRAVDDAECTAGIYLKLLLHAKTRHIETLEELSRAVKPDANTIKKMASNHVIILAANETGRQNLYHLVSESSLNYFGVGRSPRPKIPKSLLQERREGLIIGSACCLGEVFEAVKEGATEDELERLVNFYDYLEIQPLANNAFLIRDPDEAASSEEDLQNYNRAIVALGEKYSKPVCATCDVHFTNPEDEIYRTMLQAGIRSNKEIEESAALYLRTTDEMLKEFAYLGAEKAYEVVVSNTNLIADRIEKISPVRPDKCPPVIENSDQDLRDNCLKKAHEWYGDVLPEIVEERINRELNSIISNGYAVMYMIAEKLVHKSVSDGYLVGSRGSVGSSFAATMSGITEVNPLPPHYRCPKCRYSDFDSEIVKMHARGAGCDMPDRNCPECGTLMIKDGFNIPFETFLGFYGNKEPDIDLNFSGEYQSKAHAYTEVIFGKGQTFRAGTIGTVAEKTAIGYVLHYLEEEHMEKRMPEVKRLARHIVGVRRTTGQHPGGIVVLPLGEDINTFTPVQHPANDQNSPIITTHFEYHSIDHNLLKLDILGHDDPTMIRMLQDLTGLDPTEVPLDSPEVMTLFQNLSALKIEPSSIRGCTLGAMGIPEFGTDNAMGMLIEAKPQHFSDLVRISGLAHGTDVWAGNAQKLIQDGTATIATAICCRDDIMEYLLGMGLEPAMAFDIMESVRKGKGLKPEWEAVMKEHDVPDWYIWSCKKIKYMFPKAHAAAYVMMAWRIAWFKIFYPLAYYASYFSIRASGFDYELMCQGEKRLKENLDAFEARKDDLKDKEALTFRDMRIVEEMYARGYEFAPIDVYKATATRFIIVDEKRIMPSFMSISGMGDSAAEMVELASKKGVYTSLNDFRNRTHVSQTLIQKMAEMNILKGIPENDQFSLFDLDPSGE